MKLYFAPGTCALSPHVALIESGLAFTIEKVDIRAKLTQTGADYRAINPKGSVPALELDAGGILTEGPAIVQYIADQAPGAHLAPPPSTLERYRLQEWLNFIGTEIHKGFSPLFKPGLSDDGRKAAAEALLPKLAYVAQQLEDKDYLMGAEFTVADGYLFAVLRWTKYAAIDLAQWPALKAYFERVGDRPAVKQAIAAEEAA
jgi:glutathione S-transferase